MLYVSEVTNGQCHLGIHHPHNTSVHGGTKNFKISNFPGFTECLILHSVDAEEEYYGSTQDSVESPTEDPFPAE